MPNFTQEDYGIRTSLVDTTFPGSGSWQVGDFCWNSSPSVGAPIGWVCTTAGNTGGTWTAVALTPSSANGVTTLAAAGAVAATANILTTTGTTYNITLALPTVNNTSLYVTNLASGTITAVAATGAAVVGLATMATATSGEFRSNSTNWYRVS